jgi:hypothetical protein
MGGARSPSTPLGGGRLTERPLIFAGHNTDPGISLSLAWGQDWLGQYDDPSTAHVISTSHGVRCAHLLPVAEFSDTMATTAVEITRKRHYADATIAKHVHVLEELANAHGGVLPPYKWLNANGYFSSYDVMMKFPQAFAHIQTSRDKKFEIYRAHEKAKVGAAHTVGQILPPAKARTLAEYNVPGAEFNPTALRIEPGTPEADWLQIGRALASVCQSAYWWVGDWLIYGFNTYGKKTTFDLAQQATGYSRGVLYECASTARRFPPERRVEALTFYHHKMVRKFAPAVADKVLAEAAEIGLTGRQVAEAAIAEIGGSKANPHHPLQLKKVSVRLYGPTFDKLKARCRPGQKVGDLMSEIVEEWILGKPVQR